jgi:hypothetical protein
MYGNATPEAPVGPHGTLPVVKVPPGGVVVPGPPEVVKLVLEGEGLATKLGIAVEPFAPSGFARFGTATLAPVAPVEPIPIALALLTVVSIALVVVPDTGALLPFPLVVTVLGDTTVMTVVLTVGVVTTVTPCAALAVDVGRPADTLDVAVVAGMASVAGAVPGGT